MNLRHTETNLRRTESSLLDRHTVHEPLLYVQNNFFKALFYVFNKLDLQKKFTQWQNSAT